MITLLYRYYTVPTPSLHRYHTYQVHRGQPDDFTTVSALIAGARKRLKPEGVLWIVAQEQARREIDSRVMG